MAEHKKYCHGPVTSVFVENTDTPVGHTIVVDGQCYMKTGLDGGLTHPLSAIESTSSDTCIECVSGDMSETDESIDIAQEIQSSARLVNSRTLYVASELGISAGADWISLRHVDGVNTTVETLERWADYLNQIHPVHTNRTRDIKIAASETSTYFEIVLFPTELRSVHTASGAIPGWRVVTEDTGESTEVTEEGPYITCTAAFRQYDYLGPSSARSFYYHDSVNSYRSPRIFTDDDVQMLRGEY